MGEPNSVALDKCGTKSVVQICLVHQSFQSSLSLAMGKLQDAKSVIDQFGFHSDNFVIPTENEIVIKEAKLSDTLKVLVDDTGIAMKKVGYTLYGGKVYKRYKYKYIGTSERWRPL